MTKVEKSLDSIKNEFSIFFDSKDKYIYLIELGKESDGLSKNDKNTKTKKLKNMNMKMIMIVKKNLMMIITTVKKIWSSLI